MGVFGRLASLIKTNINDLISKAAAPERLPKQYEAERALAAEWEKKAMMAVRAGDDVLAKEALARRQEHDGLATQYKEQWDKQKAAVDQLKNALRQLNNKIEEAKRKKNVLI